MIPVTTLSLVAALALGQDGHDVSYKLAPSLINYTVKGAIISSYAGGIDAPASRQAEYSGVYTLKTEQRGTKWVVIGLSDKVQIVKTKDKPLSAAENKLALKGTWVQVVGGDSAYVLNSNPILPLQIGATLWPIAWMPIQPKAGLKIGDEFDQTFAFPLQAFLEDDPIGKIDVPLHYVFNGAEYPSSLNQYSFSIKTDQTINQAIKHPEDPGLKLRGRINVDARLKISKTDGRLDSASVIMSVELALEGPRYPFGFSKAKGSVSTNLQRIK